MRRFDKEGGEWFHLELTIRLLNEDFERPWLLKRENGEYSQHAHFETKKDAKRVAHLINIEKYPTNKKEKYAMQRILTEEEFKKLDKKDRYFNPACKKCIRR